MSESALRRADRLSGSALRTAGRLLALYLLTVVFNVLLGVYLWFPQYEWWRALLPVPEAAAAGVLLVPLAFAGARRRKAAAIFGLLLATALTVLFAFSVSEAFFQHVYRRSFRIAANLPLAEHFFNMLFDTDLFARRIFLLLPALAAAGLCSMLWLLLLGGGARLLRRTSPAPAIAVLALLSILALTATPRPLLSVRLASQLGGEEGLAAAASSGIPTAAAAGSESPETAAAGSETAGSGSQAAGAPAGQGNHARGAATRQEAQDQGATVGQGNQVRDAAEAHYAFPGIEDADIHLFVAESYGMTVFTNPHHRRRLEEFYAAAQKELREAGLHVRSWAYESTAFGGTSWLADATLVTGMEIDTQHKYDQAVAAGSRNLLHLLAEAGYRRVFSAPGTKFMDEEYRRFYDFTRYITYEDFAYEGPYFAYGRMPDQYQLARAAEEIFGRYPGENSGGTAPAGGASAAGEAVPAGGASPAGEASPAGGASPAGKAARAGGQAPLYVQYMLCSSHVPWNYIPPYLASWEFPQNGQVYYDRSRNTYYENSWAAGSELFAGYAHSIRYTLQSVFGYIKRELADGEIAVIVGDHQPKFPVSEKGASFAVPLHLISTREEYLQPFELFGYVEGLEPPAEADFPGLEEFLGHLLTVARAEPGSLVVRTGEGRGHQVTR
jgi:hypothetical protein